MSKNVLEFIRGHCHKHDSQSVYSIPISVIDIYSDIVVHVQFDTIHYCYPFEQIGEDACLSCPICLRVVKLDLPTVEGLPLNPVLEKSANHIFFSSIIEYTQIGIISNSGQSDSE